ncbi:adaptor-related protein complex 3, delta 1 subunit-like garnet [Rhodnius prolixus]|uniref:AP-3 complex subunit delta n=1 Tax=Rhodnius prolixus TaxID=13249 RepID=A0A905QWS8_RHOPR
MALKKVKGNLERMFDKNLTDLVRGIRNNKDNESKYIAQCIEEIKQELRQENLAVKATAVAKLTYLQMLGYDMSWAGFNVIEVMSSSKFTYKRIGYLASSQSFHADTELLMLTTNMVRKDLNSQNQYDAGLALSALSCFISTDLARDLSNDIMTLLTSTKPYLRKKAVLMMYKVFLKYPEALRPAFPRLKEKLEDPDSGVQSAAVNVVCELARKNPKNYLSLAPIFFKLMTTSTNNWMLIKIIKLFGALTPLEPRLGKKLIEPLTNLIHSTSAMSLLYECINTVIAVLISISSGMPNHSASIQLCVQKLRILIEDTDQNLKYLGLLAMSKILKTHPKSVQSHKDLVMQCLDDKDESIRLRALDLLYGMVSKKALMEIVKKLMVHMDKAEGTTYRDELLSKIIDICSQNNYQYITNFEWYVSVLVELTRMEGTQHGRQLASQMVDVAVRVPAIRRFAVAQMSVLLENSHLLAQPPAKMADVLYACAWVCAEYASELPNAKATLESLLNGRITGLPSHIQAIYVHNILKVFSKILETSEIEQSIKICDTVIDRLPVFVSSGDLEVQERACSALELVKLVKHSLEKGELEIIDSVAALFAGEMNPVAPKAQKKVQVPQGLDLDTWINEPPSSSSASEDEELVNPNKLSDIFNVSQSNETKVYKELSPEEIQKIREARRQEQELNPNYLKSVNKNNNNNRNVPSVTPIDLTVPLIIPGLASSDKYFKKTTDNTTKENMKKKKKKKKSKKIGGSFSGNDDEGDNVGEEEEDGNMAAKEVVIYSGSGEMPDGAQDSGDDERFVDRRDNDDPHKALDINLDEPIHVEDKKGHPVSTHTHSSNQRDEQMQKKVKKEKSSKKKESSNNLFLEDYEKMDTSENIVKKKKKIKHCSLSKTDENKQKSSNKKNSKKGRKRSKESPENDRVNKELLPMKDGYEEAIGISTPSKESLHLLSNQTALSRLASNKAVTIDYHIRPLGGLEGQAVTYLVITNNTKDIIKNMEINVSDTKEVQLINEMGNVEVTRKLGIVLNGGCSGETALTLRVQDITANNRLRATISYVQQVEDIGSIEDKLDVWLCVPVNVFLAGHLTEPYQELISGGLLTYSTSLQFTPPSDEPYNFLKVMQKVCNEGGLTLVEQVGDTAASLYCRASIGGGQVCLLVKNDAQRGIITVNAKSDQHSLMTAVISRIGSIIIPSESVVHKV